VLTHATITLAFWLVRLGRCPPPSIAQLYKKPCRKSKGGLAVFSRISAFRWLDRVTRIARFLSKPLLIKTFVQGARSQPPVKKKLKLRLDFGKAHIAAAAIQPPAGNLMQLFVL
jgi:hypothetical protein